MGLFSRKESSAKGGQRNSARTSSEAQAAELRVRARRRLIGALVLVLTAVIFVPMLFDSPPEEEMPVPVVMPEIIPPIPSEPQVALAPEPGQPPGDAGLVQQPQPVQPSGTAQVPEPQAGQPAEAQESKPVEAPAPKPEPPAEAPKPPAEKPATPQEKTRTDDGSVALALLEGRAPPQSAPAAQSSTGNFVLQVAAYTTQLDAQGRRDKLVAAGVTNAYVEEAVANGKTAYRLRVGPFPTREAADAAQARLRQLGYNNGLIFTK
ncbi:MAG: SPOR domain-containing protein [Alcaligenaceae bacterium]|nr:SPOR domain-containing protein [Alcaligenaceae bacterium]